MFGDAMNCQIASSMSRKGEGTATSPERELYFMTRGCDLGDKTACNLACHALSIGAYEKIFVDTDGTRADALCMRGGDYQSVIDIRRSNEARLCSGLLPRGRDACIVALKRWREALALLPENTADDGKALEAQYGASVRFACEWIKFEDCETYKDEPPVSPTHELEPNGEDYLNHNPGYYDDAGALIR